jgi:hypothetical protein
MDGRLRRGVVTAFNAVFFMRRNRPDVRARLQKCREYTARPRSGLLFNLSAGLLCIAALAGPSARAQGTAHPSDDAGGSAVCSSCHEAEAKEFEGNPHSQMRAAKARHAQPAMGMGRITSTAEGTGRRSGIRWRRGREMAMSCA